MISFPYSAEGRTLSIATVDDYSAPFWGFEIRIGGTPQATLSKTSSITAEQTRININFSSNELDALFPGVEYRFELYATDGTTGMQELIEADVFYLIPKV